MNLTIKKIVWVAMFLVLGILFSYASNFIPFFAFGFLKIDISIIFFLVPISLVGYRSSIFIIIIIGITNIAWSTTAFIGPLILIISNIVFVTCYFLLNKIIKIKHAKLINLIVATLVCSFIITLLNGIFFTPLFINFFTDVKTISFIEISNNYNNGLWYDKLKFFLMFIPDYWGGIFALYIGFNLLKFGIGSILYFMIDKLLTKNQILPSF
ncbi:MAG: MPN527 family putative ECF transporter permease subunit [Mycoplasmoidaceae bacterium]